MKKKRLYLWPIEKSYNIEYEVLKIDLTNDDVILLNFNGDAEKIQWGNINWNIWKLIVK